MNRVAVDVDTGYFVAQGSKELFGGFLERSEIQIRGDPVISASKELAEHQSGLPGSISLLQNCPTLRSA